MTRLISYGGKWKNVHSPKITDCSSHRTHKPNHGLGGMNNSPCAKCGFSISLYEEKCSETMPSGRGCYWHVICCDHHGEKK